MTLNDSPWMRLFPSEQDEADDLREARRRARQQQASAQLRCASCGRFAHPSDLRFSGKICGTCTASHEPGPRRKVEQAARWWTLVRDQG